MDPNTIDTTTSLVSQGAAATVASTLTIHLGNILMDMLPFCYVAIPLIILDLYYGRKKATYQYENNISSTPCTIEKSIKMTIQKIFNYISWIFLSASLGAAFAMPSLVIIIMSIIFGLEVLSLLNKYGESKGINIDEIGMIKLFFKFIWSRLTGNFDEDFDDVVRRQNCQNRIERKERARKRKKAEREEEELEEELERKSEDNIG